MHVVFLKYLNIGKIFLIYLNNLDTALLWQQYHNEIKLFLHLTTGAAWF